MRKVLFCLFASNSFLAMQNVPDAKPLTIVDLDYMSKENFYALTDEQKWELFEKNRELVRTYLRVVHDKNERMARVQSVLASTIADLETNVTHLQLKLVKKNSHS